MDYLSNLQNLLNPNTFRGSTGGSGYGSTGGIGTGYGTQDLTQALRALSVPSNTGTGNLGLNNPQSNQLRLGMNIPTFDLILGGLGAISNLWAANKQYKLARDSFNFSKDIANTNLDNSIRNYNTRLKDIARSRGHFEGQSQKQVDDYVKENKARRS